MKANERVTYLNLSRNQLGEFSTGSLLQQALGIAISVTLCPFLVER